MSFVDAYSNPSLDTENFESVAESVSLIDNHIAEYWSRLGKQSRSRLETLAVSAGVGVGVRNHRELVASLEMIANEELPPEEAEDEFFFGQVYLSTPWACRWVAERRGRPPSGKDPAELARARQDRFRAKKKDAESRKQAAKERKRQAKLDRLAEEKAIGADGEGISFPDGSHVYRYMAACLSDGTVLRELDRPNGITAEEALNFVAGLPKEDGRGRDYAGLFGYGFGYDWTKWLEGLPDEVLYKLYHESGIDQRVKNKHWELSMIGKCLEVLDRRPKSTRRTLVWDIIRAFQFRFVVTLQKWGVGTKEEIARLSAMKDARGTFTPEQWEEVKAYCRDECRLLAALIEKYLKAHTDAGIDLRRQYHGAGSTGGAFLREVGAEKKLARKSFLAQEAFSCAFFGGRAEISRLGSVDGPLHNYDIASAYPHALFDLPCLVHGRWTRLGQRGVYEPSGSLLESVRVVSDLRKSIRRAKVACVRYRIRTEAGPSDFRNWSTENKAELERQSAEYGTPKAARSKQVGSQNSELPTCELQPDPHWSSTAVWMKIDGSYPSRCPWGPLPYRTAKGAIVFGESSAGGWVWAPEFFQAEKGWEGVEAVEAWVLENRGKKLPDGTRAGGCQCGKPFARIGEWYVQRLQWGAEGRGLVVKLGLNSMYGKTAQTLGKNPKYRCRVISGMTTGVTRARILEAIATLEPHKRWDVIYVATDGIITTRELDLPETRVNETLEEASKTKKAMLGAWEHNVASGRVHILQPGFYFNLDDASKVKTRGTPADVIVRLRQSIVDQWQVSPMEPPRGLPKRTSFRGVKTSILPPTKHFAGYRRKKSYGRWEEEVHDVAYVTYPKRSTLIEGHCMATWHLAQSLGPSAVYAKDAILSTNVVSELTDEETLKLKEMETIRDEQPDWREDGGHVGEVD